MEQVMPLLNPLRDQIMAMNELKDANRGSPYINHLTAMSEGIGALPWVTVDSKPYKHVEEMYGTAQYWGNRVLKEYKDKSVSCRCSSEHN